MSPSRFSAPGVCQTLAISTFSLFFLNAPLHGAQSEGSDSIPRLGRPGGDRLEIAKQFDRDRDGILSKSERIAARLYVHDQRREKLIADLMRKDQNGDGKVTEEEMSSGRRRRGPSFKDVDTNGDGAIDIAEAGATLYRGRSGPEGRDYSGAERLLPSFERDFGSGLYDEGILRTLFLEFEDDQWLDEMHDFYRTDVPVPADLIVAGKTIRNVGVRYRGNSSFGSVPPELKRSIDIEIDHGNKDERLLGYKTLNLLNAHDDPTFMREVLYSRIGRQYIPAFRGNFVKLVVNGESWGIYPNIQQYNNDFLEEWFGSRGGVRWKGRGSLTYEGTDRERYSGRYIVKTDDAPDEAWDALIELCRVLKETPDETLIEALNPIFNIDGALWSIALENVFVDEGYLTRGSDYNLFRDADGRFHLLQHDGNEVFNRPGGPGIPRGMDATKLPLYHLEESEGRPVVHRLLSNPQFKSRYTAHVRTIVDEWLNWDNLEPVVASYRKLIEKEVEKDVRKESSFEDFANGDVSTVKGGRVLGLKQFVEKRRDFLLGHAELSAPTSVINSVSLDQNSGQPTAGQPVQVRVDVVGAADEVGVYWATERYAPFQYVALSANGEEGAFGGVLPAYPVNTQVFYYAEVRSGGDTMVSDFSPNKAEASPYTYTVRAAAPSDSVIVINEVLAENRTVVQDPQGDYDDFIELFNLSDEAVDLSGMFLSDVNEKPRKFAFPDGTVIDAKGYLVVWADENGKAKSGVHANFKISSKGEVIRLIDSDERGNGLLDELVLDSQKPDRSYGRSRGSDSRLGSLVPSPGAAN
jgi:hypothetical protein